ncbi:MAG: hypothetical protein DRJ47_08620 [Thermoprotei archaeon]|nr:MAG: hypothetical protein DRJ47_08620 [Thermoprotei archaeon]
MGKVDRKPFIVALIPAYNEENSIAGVVLRVQRQVDKVIVCDDGSRDLTGEIAERLGAEVIRHEKNLGKGVALRNLLRKAREFNPDIVVVLDADGQHDPEEIPRLVEPLKKGMADMVIGSRYVGGAVLEAPLYRRIGLKIINFLNRRLIKSTIKDTQSGFRAFTVKALEALEEAESRGFGIESEQIQLAIKKGLRIIEVPVTIRYKGLKETSKKPPILHGGEIIATILRLIVEERPLLYLGMPGSILIAASIALGTYLLWLFNTTRYFSIPIAIITLGATFIGITLLVAALTLYALKRTTDKIKTEKL